MKTDRKFDMTKIEYDFAHFRYELKSGLIGPDDTNIDGRTALSEFIWLVETEVYVQSGRLINEDGTRLDESSMLLPFAEQSLEERGLVEMLDWFIDFGVDPNMDKLLVIDHEGSLETGMLAAIKNCDVAMVEYLLKHGCDLVQTLEYHPYMAPPEEWNNEASGSNNDYVTKLASLISEASGERFEGYKRIAVLFNEYGHYFRDTEGGNRMPLYDIRNGKIVAFHDPNIRYEQLKNKPENGIIYEFYDTDPEAIIPKMWRKHYTDEQILAAYRKAVEQMKQEFLNDPNHPDPGPFIY